MPECPNCEQVYRGRSCRECGWSAEAGGKPERKPRTVCDCGARLMGSGLCSAMGGYPATSACPIACPVCGGLLGWDGGCDRCHGCTSGLRADWAFPGDRYELQKGHWQRVEGPRRACTPAENAAGFAEVRRILGGGSQGLVPPGRLVPDIDPAIRAELERRGVRSAEGAGGASDARGIAR